METTINILLAITSAATTLVAAYYGAKFAFDFQNSKQDKEQAKNDVRNANLAIINLLAAHHHLTSFKEYFVDSKIDAPDRHFSILPLIGVMPRVTIDIDRLSFLMSTKNPSIVHGISLATIDINLAIDLIRARSDFHSNELQPRMEVLETSILSAHCVGEIEALIGNRITKTIKQLTDTMIIYLDQSLITIPQVIQKLHQATKEIYPDHLVAKMNESSSREQT